MMFIRRRKITKTNCMVIRFANGMLSLILLSCALFLFFSHPVCSARDTMTKVDQIKNDGSEGLVSAGGKFELGFFSPKGTGSSGIYKRYVGIWYHNVTPMTVVWVANRDYPLPANYTGVLKIYDDTLQVLDSNMSSRWSAQIEETPAWTVNLKDDGNLVVLSKTASVLWESFKNPTDTFIPGMKMDKSFNLTSWNATNDPGSGNFIFQLDQDNQYIIKKKTTEHWKSGVQDAKFPSPDMPTAVFHLLSNFRTKSEYISTRLVIDFTGQLNWFAYSQKWQNWSLNWWEPKDNCSLFNRCGDFGICNINKNKICHCLQGFKPQFQNQWDSGDFSGGCTRDSKLCNPGATRSDTFFRLKVKRVIISDFQPPVDNELECTTMCLNNCQCQAYSYRENDIRSRTPNLCLIWNLTTPSNIEEGDHGDHNFSARIALTDSEGSLHDPSNPSPQSSLGENSSRKVPFSLIIVAVLISMILLACTISILVWRRKMTNKKDHISRAQLDSERRAQELIDTSEFNEEDEKGLDVPFFDLQSILEATDYFSDVNKLGQGGYGPVYKGLFPGGQEFAVKRLSKVSGQGLQEFRNEVVLIAKLQHRNLVRLRGFCMKGEEKILLYEYMPNKSLDSFILDHTKSAFLNWEMRFNIILGVARGLLYLHQDSRLRIIHRDLKTSNVLLDEEMNPKISDFGLARIVGGKETEANTNTVVGTYGYMSPEYALDGTFSVKSDVFSFGVVLLEIISGKKNAGFFQSKQTFSLLGYAWELWTEDKVLDIMDKNLEESCNRSQFIKCVNVGLLCVQEDPVDRPTMSNVVTLLDSETAIPAIPKQPAFFLRRGNSSTASSSTKPEITSDITTLEGR